MINHIKPYVAIVTSDRGWILEKYARELCSRLNYVRYVEAPDSHAIITCYITQSCWRGKISPIEVAVFPHIEPNIEEKERSFFVASQMDYCICMSKPYLQMLKDRGIKKCSIVEPGFDPTLFRPKLQIGVVGRTYKSGRKGEKLIENIMDIDWIDWHFTGDGWPGPSLHLTDDKLPDFYRKMDYILVPSLYEGGPMCVVEALACGTPVIAPSIGWVPKFPHIEFHTGDAADLRRVLTELYLEKKNLSESVASVTWENYALGYDKIFRTLAGEHNIIFYEIKPKDETGTVNLVYAKHMNDNQRMERTVTTTEKYLNLWTGYRASIQTTNLPFSTRYQIEHFFCSDLNAIRIPAESAYKNDISFIISWFLNDVSKWDNLLNIIQISLEHIDTTTHDKLRRLLESDSLFSSESHDNKEVISKSIPDAFMDILEKSSHVFFDSNYTMDKAIHCGFEAEKGSVLYPPIEPIFFANITPDAFLSRFKLSAISGQYVFCAGDMLPENNQLMLAIALQKTNIPVIFAGRNLDSTYGRLVKICSNPHCIFMDPLDNYMFVSACTGARLFCLPSLNSGASLIALQAGAAGCPLVLGASQVEQEYLGDLAKWCNPENIFSVHDTVIHALEAHTIPGSNSALRQHIHVNFSTEKYIEKISNTYSGLASRIQINQIDSTMKKKIYIDVTSSAHRNGPPTGIARVECECVKRLSEMLLDRIQIILWNSARRIFIPVSFTQFKDSSYKSLAQTEHDINYDSEYSKNMIEFKQESLLLVLGASWIGNDKYLNDLLDLVTGCKLAFFAMIYDTIPYKFKHIFPKGQGDKFTVNCLKIIEKASLIITESDNSENDILNFAAEHDISVPHIEKFPFGSDMMLAEEDPFDTDISKFLSLIGTDQFVIFVSSINIMKNHILVYEIWQRMILEYGEMNVPHLFFVGRRFDGTEQFIQMLENDEKSRRRVHILHGVSDNELDWLYRNCLFTVFPSRYEGWGIPVGESLAYRKICIASDVSSIPEIAPEYTDLIDPADFKQWYERITGYIFNKKLREAREKQLFAHIPITWDEAAKTLAQIIKNHNNLTFQPSLLGVGDEIRAAKAEEFNKFCGGGWESPDDDGRWSKGKHSSIVFKVLPSKLPMLFSIVCKTKQPQYEDAPPIRIFVNGAAVLNIFVKEEYGIYSFILPERVGTEEGGVFHIDFFSEVLQTRQNKTNQIWREYGFKLNKFTLSECLQEDLNKERVFSQLEKIIEGWEVCFRSLVSIRHDLFDIYNPTLSNCAINIFLWAWRYGIREELCLLPYRTRIQDSLVKLHSITHSQAFTPEYTSLIHAIWISRPDLHFMAADSQEGQKAIIAWFNTNGIAEYNLKFLFE